MIGSVNMKYLKYILLVSFCLMYSLNIHAEEFAGTFSVDEAVLSEEYPTELSTFPIDQSFPEKFIRQASLIFEYDTGIYQTSDFSLQGPLFKAWNAQTDTEHLWIDSSQGVFSFQYIKQLPFNPFGLSLSFINYFEYPDQRHPDDNLDIDDAVTQQDLSFMSRETALNFIEELLTNLGIHADYTIHLYALPKEYYSILEEYSHTMKAEEYGDEKIESKDFYAIRINFAQDGIVYNTQTMGSIEKGSVVVGTQLFLTLTEDGVTSFTMNGYEQADVTQAETLQVDISKVIDSVQKKYDNLLIVGEVSLIDIVPQYYLFVNTQGNESKAYIRPFWQVKLEHKIPEEEQTITYYPMLLIDAETNQEVILQ